VLATSSLACGGEARPTQAEWAAAAHPVLAEILVASSSITAIRSRLPGDYVPPGALRACDEIETQLASWRLAIDPGPVEEVDPLVDLLFDGLEGTCSALRAGDIGLAQTEWAQTQSTLAELYSLSD
jgi:hypothetical protein